VLRKKTALNEGHGFSRAVNYLRLTAKQAAEKPGVAKNLVFWTEVRESAAVATLKG
jgi:hypothetical protein